MFLQKLFQPIVVYFLVPLSFLIHFISGLGLGHILSTFPSHKKEVFYTSYLTDSYIVFTLKMESQPKNIIFSLKMMMKSGLEKIILKFLHAQSLFWKIFFTSQKGEFLHQIANSVIKMTFFAHGGISIKLFVVYLHIINECLSYKFHPYSILTGHTKVKSVAYQVLNVFSFHL